MAYHYTSAALFLLGIILVRSSLQISASETEYERRLLKDLETRKLLQEMEELNQVEEELEKRVQEEIARQEIFEILREERKRDEIPIIRRFKMTPPPGESQPDQIFRRPVTPVPGGRMTPEPPAGMQQPLGPTPKQHRPTPFPPVLMPEEPANIDISNIVIPRGPTPVPPPRRATPAPGSPEYEAAMAARNPVQQQYWDWLLAQRAEREQARRDIGDNLHIGYINPRPHEKRGYNRGIFY